LLGAARAAASVLDWGQRRARASRAAELAEELVEELAEELVHAGWHRRKTRRMLIAV
jgi:hypothetical protein